MGIRIVIIDDHEVLRMGLMALLSDSEIDVVGETSWGAEAIQVIDASQPEVALLDVRLSDIDGLTVLDLIRRKRPKVKVVMLSAYDNPMYIANAISSGASGFLKKTISRGELIAAVERISGGKDLWSSEQLRRVGVALAVPRTSEDFEASLTGREAEVLRHLAQGFSNNEIAQILGISYETVKEHVQHVLRKLGVVDRTQAAIWAVWKKLA